MKEKTMNLIQRIYRLLSNLKQTTYRLFCTIIVSLTALFCFNPSAYAATIFVDGATGDDDTNNGTSWPEAFETLQKALDEASGGDQIWVAAGTYHPDEGPTQTPGDAGATYDMIADVAVYGGFLNGDDFGDRDPMANETILSGDIPAPGNNSNNVVSFSVLSGNPAILDGFTVRDGSSNGFGGGIIVHNTEDARIRNCIIRDNYATTGGGLGVPPPPAAPLPLPPAPPRRPHASVAV